MKLEELTVKELQDSLVELGMPRDDVEAFKTKAPLIASIKTLQTKDAEHEVEVVEAAASPATDDGVKKVASIEEKPNPVEERVVDRKWKAKQLRMYEHLMGQEQVSILVPLEPAEKAGVVEWRTDKYGRNYQVHISGAIIKPILNGLGWMIPKGKYTKVPMQIAEIVSNSQQQILDAGKDIRVDRIDPTTGRPVAEAL